MSLTLDNASVSQRNDSTKKYTGDKMDATDEKHTEENHTTQKILKQKVTHS